MGNFFKLFLVGCGIVFFNIELKKKLVSNVYLYVFKSFDYYFFMIKKIFIFKKWKNIKRIFICIVIVGLC